MRRQVEALRAQMQQFGSDDSAARARVAAAVRHSDHVRAEVDALLTQGVFPAGVAQQVRGDLQRAHDDLAATSQALGEAVALLTAAR